MQKRTKHQGTPLVLCPFTCNPKRFCGVFRGIQTRAAQRWRAQAQVILCTTTETIGNDRLTSGEQNRC